MTRILKPGRMKPTRIYSCYSLWTIPFRKALHVSNVWKRTTMTKVHNCLRAINMQCFRRASQRFDNKTNTGLKHIHNQYKMSVSKCQIKTILSISRLQVHCWIQTICLFIEYHTHDSQISYLLRVQLMTSRVGKQACLDALGRMARRYRFI